MVSGVPEKSQESVVLDSNEANAMSGGAERAARRIAETILRKELSPDWITHMAAIIREETGTQLEPNHHWKWFLNYGQAHCPHKDQEWHKATPELCRPCDYARHAALDYAAAAPDEGGKR